MDWLRAMRGESGSVLRSLAKKFSPWFYIWGFLFIYWYAICLYTFLLSIYLPIYLPMYHLPIYLCFPSGSVVKNLPAMQKMWVWTLGWEDPLEEEMGNPLQYPCLGNPRDRGAWWVRTHGVAKEPDTTQQINNNTIYIATIYMPSVYLLYYLSIGHGCLPIIYLTTIYMPSIYWEILYEIM